MREGLAKQRSAASSRRGCAWSTNGAKNHRKASARNPSFNGRTQPTCPQLPPHNPLLHSFNGMPGILAGLVAGLSCLRLPNTGRGGLRMQQGRAPGMLLPDYKRLRPVDLRRRIQRSSRSQQSGGKPSSIHAAPFIHAAQLPTGRHTAWETASTARHKMVAMVNFIPTTSYLNLCQHGGPEQPASQLHTRLHAPATRHAPKHTDHQTPTDRSLKISRRAGAAAPAALPPGCWRQPSARPRCCWRRAVWAARRRSSGLWWFR